LEAACLHASSSHPSPISQQHRFIYYNETDFRKFQKLDDSELVLLLLQVVVGLA
jgi:uracil DNA glycosylase